MNVQELIDKLKLIKDKKLPVLFCQSPTWTSEEIEDLEVAPHPCDFTSDDDCTWKQVVYLNP